MTNSLWSVLIESGRIAFSVFFDLYTILFSIIMFATIACLIAMLLFAIFECIYDSVREKLKPVNESIALQPIEENNR